MEWCHPLMDRPIRPWDVEVVRDRPFGPSDCLVCEATQAEAESTEHSVLMRGTVQGAERVLLQYPYPGKSSDEKPERHGFPLRPRFVREARTEEEVFAQDTLRRMNEVISRIHELEQALDDPLNVWPRLRKAWIEAQDEANPRMAEIVKQSDHTLPYLKELERRKRRVLRRTRERVPLDRVQEMDRRSMQWLVRQPGRNILERAGSSQRIHAVTRRENFDTPENRVFHAYCRLASDVAREWLR